MGLQRARRFEWFGILLVVASLTGLVGVQRAQEKAGGSKEIALVGARIYPGPEAKAIANGVVVVAGGKIVSVGEAGSVEVPKDAEKIDCSGKTLVAGMWNAHVHFIEDKWKHAEKIPAKQLTKQMQEMLTGYGFTSVVDTGSLLENTIALRKRVETGEVAGPRILTAGMILFPEHGLPFYITENVPADDLKVFAMGEVATPADAVKLVDEQIAEGADIVKLYVVTWLRPGGPNGKIEPYPMPLAIVKAATEEAHRKGKLVFAHPSTAEGVELVLAGHVDVLAHTTEEPEKWDEAVSERLKKANVTLIPTLTLFAQDKDFDLILKEVKSYEDVGGQIMYGTDVGYLLDYVGLTKEYEYLARAGLTFPQILAMLTTTPAGRMGFGNETGQVKPEMDADLVMLEGDPARDVNAFANVAMTMRAGRIVYQNNKE